MKKTTALPLNDLAAASDGARRNGDSSGFWRSVKVPFKRLFRDEKLRDKRRFLHKVFLFQGLGDRALAIVAHRMMEKAYGGGEVIFQEGDVGRACFIVAQGTVEVTQTGGDGKEEPLAVMEPGDFFGEVALLDELPRSATARALGPVRLYILYKTHFDALLRESPRAASDVLLNLARLMSARLRRRAEASREK